MRLFPKHYEIESEKNGTITVREFLWWFIVYAGGFEQSGPYLDGLWGASVKKIQNPTAVKLVLLLGLGGGSNVRIVEKHFPNATITAIEWDHAMIGIALKLHRFKTTPNIIHGDLRDVLPSLEDTYDVILSDAFYGDQPDVGADTNVGASLSKILSPRGYYLLNASRTPAAIEYISRFLHLEKTWKFRDNTIALFRPDTKR